MPYTYDAPHPAVTVDAVALLWRDKRLHMLLVRRRNPPFEGRWAFPGGFIEIDEELEAAARRELREETGIEAGLMEQLGAFGDPDRDPRERVITVAFLAPLRADDAQAAKPASDAAETQWFAVDELPRLAFDHGEIMARAMERLSTLMQTTPIALHLMPSTFSFADVSELHEEMTGKRLSKSRWEDWILAEIILAEDDRFSLCVELQLNEL